VPALLDTWLTAEEFETGWLTVEHVPPLALGGGELVLTCKECNNNAGGRFDGPAAEEQRIRQYLSGRSGDPRTAALTVDGVTANVRMHITGQAGMLFTLDPKINKPGDVPILVEHMQKLSETGNADFGLGIAPRLRYFPDRARISWIRAAYLAAFALFGWKYILQTALNPIREQLMNPLPITLPPLSMYAPDGDLGRREIWVIKEPAEYQSLLVVAGQHGVFLPLPDDPRSLAELAGSLNIPAEGPATYAFTGAVSPWPSTPGTSSTRRR
jgi:hypothetical protein